MGAIVPLACYSRIDYERRVRLLRGQVVIRETGARLSPTIWTPAPGQRQVSTHRGVVLAMGPPARDKHGNEIEPGFRVGEEVQYHWEHNEDTFTRIWPEDGLPACWVRQFAVDGVWES